MHVLKALNTAARSYRYDRRTGSKWSDSSGIALGVATKAALDAGYDKRVIEMACALGGDQIDNYIARWA